MLAGGRVFAGCNVENASFGLTICAERNAIFAAVASGARRIEAIALACVDASAAASAGSLMPCGACRQVMAEFSPQMWVYWRNSGSRIMKKRLSALLPDMFEFPRGRTKTR